MDFLKQQIEEEQAEQSKKGQTAQTKENPLQEPPESPQDAAGPRRTPGIGKPSGQHTEPFKGNTGDSTKKYETKGLKGTKKAPTL